MAAPNETAVDETETADETVGDAAPAAKPADKPKTFTQEEVNALLAKDKRELKKKLKEAEDGRSALEKRFSDLETKLTVEPKAEDKTADGRLEASLKKLEKELEASRIKMQEVEERAQRAEAKRIEALKDRALTEALQQAGCIDLKAGQRYFLPDLLDKDDDDEPLVDQHGNPTWAIRLTSGTLADLSTGIAETLPKYLRNPNGNVGGAGTVAHKSGKQKDKVEELEKKVQLLADKARKSGYDGDIASYVAAKKQLQALKTAPK